MVHFRSILVAIGLVAFSCVHAQELTPELPLQFLGGQATELRSLHFERTAAAPVEKLEQLQSVASSPSSSSSSSGLVLDTPTGIAPKWSFSFSQSNVNSENSDTSKEFTASLRAYGAMGSVALESMELQRFGLRHSAWAVDAYPRLWDGAYANVRYQAAATVGLYPNQSGRFELYQGLTHGWELAVSRDYLGFDSPVSIDGVGIGKYWGNFYARWRHIAVHKDTSSSGDRVMLRYYYEGDSDHYVEVNLSQGRSDDVGSALSGQSSSDARGLSWSSLIDKNWGFKLAFTQSVDNQIGQERDLTLSVSRRW
jgi:hypothetical protein